MDVVAEGVKGIITYLDDILAHSKTFEEHLGVLRKSVCQIKEVQFEA